MDLLAERGRRVSVDELNTTRLLAHARKQAVQRNLDDEYEREARDGRSVGRRGCWVSPASLSCRSRP